MTWTQDLIGTWADQTFGRSDSAAVIGARANVEMAELLRALARDHGGLSRQVADAAADVAILLLRLAHVAHFDLAEAIDRKMRVNIERIWEPAGDGTGRHVRVKG